MPSTLTTRSLLALPLILGVLVAVRFHTQRTDIGDRGRSVVQLYLGSQYASAAISAMLAPDGERGNGRTPKRHPLRDGQVEIRDLSAQRRGEDVIVRVEVRVAGEAPPDGREVRYVRLSPAPIVGWMPEEESSALAYYSTLF